MSDGVHAAGVDKIDVDRYADLLEPSAVQCQLDLGNAMICKVIHPVLGVLILINTIGAEHGVVYL